MATELLETIAAAPGVTITGGARRITASAGVAVFGRRSEPAGAPKLTVEADIGDVRGQGERAQPSSGLRPAGGPSGEHLRDLAANAANQLVVRAVVDIARGLGKRTVAEYVGDRRTLELTREYGIDYAQGFYLGKPVPIDGRELDGPDPAFAQPRVIAA